MELTRDEELALLKALAKKVKERLDVLEFQAKDEVMAGYIENGTDRRSIIIEGVKVGEIGLSYSKAKPAIKPGFERWALTYLDSCGLVEYKPATGWEKRFARVGAQVVDQETGEVMEWAEWLPQTASTAAIRGCKPDDVVQAFGPKLDGFAFAGLLEG